MNTHKNILMAAGLALVTLAACLSGTATLAQDQQQAPQQPPVQQTAPPPPQQTSDAGAPPAQQGPPPAYQPYQAALPPTLTLQAGTIITVRVFEQLSSDRNQVGDRFSASIEQPLVANGFVVADRGQPVSGHVVVAKKAGHGGGDSQLGLQIDQLTMIDGQILPVNTQFVQVSARTPGRNPGIIASTTVLGAAIGGAVGGGPGAAIGAGIGLTAGAATAASTRGAPTVIYPEQLLTFRLQAPLTISTEQSQAAFESVGQGNYSRGDQDAYAQPGGPGPGGPYYGGPAYYGAPYPYPYPYYGYGWGYPYFGFGFYGPGFYGGYGGFRGGYGGYRGGGGFRGGGSRR